MGFRISVDTGGTFTDIVVMDDAGQQTIGKALTTKNRIFLGMREAVEVAARDLGMTMPDLLAQTDLLIYGTTRATNAIVTRTVAKTAFVTTMGFPDTLVLKEGGKVNPHDFTKDYPEPYVPRRYVVLGADGFGRSDTREKLRGFFEVDRRYVTVAALKALADEGSLPADKVADAIAKYGIDPAKPPPWTV